MMEDIIKSKKQNPFESPPRDMETSENFSSPILDRTNKLEPDTPLSKKSFSRSPFIKNDSNMKRHKTSFDSPNKNDSEVWFMNQPLDVGLKRLDISYSSDENDMDNDAPIFSPFKHNPRKSLFNNSNDEENGENNKENKKEAKKKVICPFGTPSPTKLMENTSFLTPNTPHDLSSFRSNFNSMNNNNPKSAPQSPKGIDLDDFKIKSSGHKRSLSHHYDNSMIIYETERDINTNPYTPPSNRIQKKREEKIVARSKYTTEFSEIERLGSGEFSDVYLATNKLDGVNYAIKRIRKPLEKKESSEIYTLAAIGSHPNLMRYYSSWKDEENYIFIQLEYCSGGDLSHKIKKGEKMSQKYLLNICKLMLSALEYLHKLELVHLDVKPENIYICKEGSEDTFKLGDFGFVMSSKLKDKKDLDESYGDDHYASPEIRNCDWNVLVGKLEKSDIFSLGATLIALAFHSTDKSINEDIKKIQNFIMPITSDSPNKSKNNNNNNEININYNKENHNDNFLSHPSYDPSFFDLLRSMVHPDVDQRSSIPHLYENPLLISDLQRKYLRAKNKRSLLKKQILMLTQNNTDLFAKLDLLITQQSNFSDKLDQFTKTNKNNSN